MIRLLVLVTLVSALLVPATPAPSHAGRAEVGTAATPTATKAVLRILDVAGKNAPQPQPCRPSRATSTPLPNERRPLPPTLATVDRVAATKPPAIVHDARRAIRRARPARHVPRRGDDDPAAA